MSRPDQMPKADVLFRPLIGALSNLKIGSINVTLPSGRQFNFVGADTGPQADLVIHSPRLIGRMLMSGTLGLAEGYMAGDWTSTDVVALIRVGEMNRSILGPLDQGGRLMRALQWCVHAFRANTKRGARRNIQAHYDLGNAFYRLWLDPSMTYSSAVFDPPDQDLASAQLNKYDTILAMLKPTDTTHILEIGSGWGGFAQRAVEQTGCRVTSITLSQAQLEEAQARIQHAGLADRVTFKLQDYRDVRGQFDGIASIEMFEAVGEQYWPGFFTALHDRLTPQGLAALQVITIRDDLFAAYRKSVDFIQRYIFPGGMLPSPQVFKQSAEHAGLEIKAQVFRGLDYAKTLSCWDEAFQDKLDEVKAMGFDDRFIRMWHFYLAYCEAGFRQKTIDLMQVSLARS